MATPSDIFDDLTQLLPGFLYVYSEEADGTRRLEYASEGTRELFGVSPEQMKANPDLLWSTLHPDDLPRVLESVRRSKRERCDWSSEHRVRHPERGVIWVHGRARRSAAEAGATRWAGFIQDVTARKLAELATEEKGRALAAETARLEKFFDLSVDLLGIGDHDGRFVRLSRAWPETLGWPIERMLDRSFVEWVHPDDQAETQARLDALRRGERVVGFVNRYRRADGGVRSLEWRATPADDGLIYFAARDVTARLEMEERLQAAKLEAERRAEELQAAQAETVHTALHDPLTGLPNRRYLEREMARLTERVGCRGGGSVVALHIDLDRFKQINDGFGHAAGDEVLRQTAEALRAHAGPNDFVARVGGDEFVVICCCVGDLAQAAELAARLVDAMEYCTIQDGRRMRMGASIGAAARSAEGLDPSGLLQDADVALYRAKRAGRNRCAWFSEEVRRQLVARNALIDELEQALQRDELELRYQPQICARSGAVVGAEALVRWRHPRRGVLPPQEFIDVAESCGLIAAIDRFVLERVLQDRAAILAAGEPPLRIAVNVSSARIRDPEFVDQIEALAPPKGALAIELVESIFLDDSDTALAAEIARLKALGVQIEIDDFGTGHASIVGLLKLRPHRLKIDRQFVMRMFESPQGRTLVSAMTEIGRSLGVGVVAEGVETAEHARALSAMGCELLQGYHFAKPLPLPELCAFLEERAAADRPVGAALSAS